ncbi:putative ribonuclease H-like domain-containing protein [Tanacetum coccineum]
MVPRAVLLKSGLVSVNTSRQVNVAHSKTTVNVARPMSYLSKIAHSTVKRPIHKNITFKNCNLNQRVSIVKGKNVNTAKPKAVVNVVKGNNVNVVKASACWIQVSDSLGPKKKLIFLSNVQGNPQIDLQDQGLIDSGCLRHMTGNMSYLTDYEEIDRGYVSFGGNPKGGKITGRGIIKTGNLDFENVYFVKELKFNLFSVLQMCEKKNNVLFNDTECIVLSPNFKLTDESYVLLKVPRKNNMYSVDLKNIVPKGGLTCLFAKATSDQSEHWHRRLGHINFKTMNKLVKGNLLRGLPSKLFENNQTYVACQKGKQHRASFERKNRTLIEAARTMLADSKLPTTFWAEAVNTGCYVQNKVLVTMPHSKTPYELFLGRKPALSFMKPFGCHITILNTIDHLGKFDGKADEGFIVSENIPNITGSGPNWLFDIDTLTKSMNYKPVVTGNQSNGNADPPFSQISKSSQDDGSKPLSDDEKKVDEDPRKDSESIDQEKDDNVNNTNNVNAASINEVNVVGGKTSIELPLDLNMPKLEDYSIFEDVEDVVEPKKVIQALQDPSWIEAMQDQLLQFKLQKVWTLVDLPNGKRPIGTKWVFRNKKDERGIVIKNKARLVAQGYTQEERINYDEVFGPVTRIEAIRLFLAYASFKVFVVYQMDVKSAFLYDDIIFGSTKKSLCTEFEKMMHKKFQMSSIGKLTFFLGLQVNQKEDGIFISQDKYVTEILKKFGFTDVKTASTPMETQKLLLKDEDGKEVDVHLYRSMIGSLMYLTSLRPDIMFAVCACARYQVNPKVSHLHTVKRFFSDDAGTSLDRKSTTRGCQLFISRLISWQCKKQTVVTNSTTKAGFVAASSCYGQVVSEPRGSRSRINKEFYVKFMKEQGLVFDDLRAVYLTMMWNKGNGFVAVYEDRVGYETC